MAHWADPKVAPGISEAGLRLVRGRSNGGSRVVRGWSVIGPRLVGGWLDAEDMSATPSSPTIGSPEGGPTMGCRFARGRSDRNMAMPNI